MGIMEGGMSWAEMKEIVDRQIDKLALCKRGAIFSDINEQLEVLGREPQYTKEEKEAIKNGLDKKIKKALTPTLAQVRKYSLSDLKQKLNKQVEAVLRDAFVHPNLKAWKKKRDAIKQQERERIATLDGDVQDIKDRFHLGIVPIEDFPKVRDEFEAKDW